MKETNRYQFLDFLRFVAAGAVIVQHSAERLIPSFGSFSANYFKFGSFGVTLFFLISGFIIPASIEKHGSLKRFWISRVFRLYPLYIFSIITTLTLIYLGLIKGELPSVLTVLANLLMIAKFVGAPLIQGLFWTLNVEMVFYILVSILFLLGAIRNSISIALVALGGSFLFGVIGTQLFHFSDKGWGTINSIATMFVGTVCFRYFKDQISTRTFLSIIALFIFVTINVNFWNVTDEDLKEGHSFLSLTNAFLLALILFIFSFYFKEVKYPKVLVYLGVISYSLYLIQDLVFDIIPVLTNPYLTLFLWISVIVGISILTYHGIEKPFVKVGQNARSSKMILESPGITHTK